MYDEEKDETEINPDAFDDDGAEEEEDDANPEKPVSQLKKKDLGDDVDVDDEDLDDDETDPLEEDFNSEYEE